MKDVLNSLLTTARVRFMHDVVVGECPFCGMHAGDDRRHWVECSVLHRIFNDLYGGQTALTVCHDSFHLQIPLGGRELQLLLAFVHAIWRC